MSDLHSRVPARGDFVSHWACRSAKEGGLGPTPACPGLIIGHRGLLFVQDRSSDQFRETRENSPPRSDSRGSLPDALSSLRAVHEGLPDQRSSTGHR